MTWRARISRSAWVLSWMVLAIVAVVAILRIFQPGGSEVVILVASLTPWPFFLAWPIAAAGLTRRHWTIVGPALALVVVQVVLVLPTWRPDVTAAAPVGTWRLKIFDANVLYDNTDLNGIAREIEADHPDVVTLEEISPLNVQSLFASGAINSYRYHLMLLEPGSGGYGVWSDVPITGAETWWADHHGEFSGTLHPPTGAPISLLAIHTRAPHGSSTGSWEREMSAIAARSAAAPKPEIVVGDFNATNDVKQFRVLLHQHLHDAAVARGQGWRMTWPRNLPVIPPFLRPDHLLYSDGLTATAYSVGHGAGSDHKPILITLARAAP